MAEELKNISLTHKKEFTIDGDSSRILALDTADLNIMVRLEEAYPGIQALAVEASDRMAAVPDVKEGEETSSLNDITGILKDIDMKMREKIDYIFDSNVSEVCVPKGNMFDPINGEFRFEHIIEVLCGLYADSLSEEFKKIQARIKKHTAKYTKTSSIPNKRKK